MPGGGLAGQAGSPDGDRGPPLVGDRPDFTESASVVRRPQLETGYTFEDAGTAELHTLGELLVRIPATRRLELRLGVPSWVRREGSGTTPESSGLTDASVGVKLGLGAPEARRGGPALALLAGTTLPTGDEFGADGLHPGVRLAAGMEVSGPVSLGANAGLTSAQGEDGRHAELLGSLSLGVGLSERAAAYVEAYGAAPTEAGLPSSSVLDAGVTWLLDVDLQLDVRLGAGLSGPAPDVLLGTGVVWRP